RLFWALVAAGELRSMAVCTAVRMELPANGDTTHCRGCGRRNFPAQRVIAGGVAASKRGFPERAWKWITSAQQAFLSRALRSSREAPQANLPRSPRSIDSKTGSRGVWRKSSIFSIDRKSVGEGKR